MWDRLDDRLALLELVRIGSLRRRASQERAWSWLSELPWTRATGRRDELSLVADHAPELIALLDRLWPDWRDVDARLGGAGLPPSPRGWRALRDLERADAVGAVPDRLNRRTASSAIGPHAKASLTGGRRAALGDTELTHDGLVRIRPPSGMVLRRRDRSAAVDAIVGVLDELVLSDRALRDGTQLVGEVRAVLLVENLGAWRDLHAPAGWLVAHVPGWDTATVRLLLPQLERAPALHFGDLDPNGVRIYRHLRAVRSDLRWFVPPFWSDYLDEALIGRWPDDLDLADAPELVRALARQGRWLEQERIVLDPRFARALEASVP